jgi:hypothetical protein
MLLDRTAELLLLLLLLLLRQRIKAAPHHMWSIILKGRLHAMIVGPTVGPTTGGLSTLRYCWTNGHQN